MILFGSIDHAQLIARAAGTGFDPNVDFVVSRTNKRDELLGGVIYTEFTGTSIQMHMAGFSPVWTTPHFMFAIYDFPFNCLRVDQVIGTVPSTNKRALKIDYQMGFKHFATIPGAVRDGDMEILAMPADQCKYLKLGWRYRVLEAA